MAGHSFDIHFEFYNSVALLKGCVVGIFKEYLLKVVAAHSFDIPFVELF